MPVPAQRAGTDKLKMVKAYDDHTVVYFHKEPLVTNVWNVNFSIIPKHVYEETIPLDPTLTDSDAHVDIEENPVTGGPYTIASRSTSEVVLERRESYFMHNGEQVRDKPHYKTIRFRINPDNSTALLAMKAGDIDYFELEAAQWSSQTDGNDFYEKNTKARAIEWVNFAFFWNNKSKFFDDARVRQAMSYAFDHEEAQNQDMIKKCLYLLGEAEKLAGDEDAAYARFVSLQEHYPDTPNLPELLMGIETHKLINLWV